MKLRPKIRVGDIVKLSKKGKTYHREFSLASTMIVTEVLGNGIDRNSVVTCRVKCKESGKYVKFYRSELWATSVNLFDKNGIKTIDCSKIKDPECRVC